MFCKIPETTSKKADWKIQIGEYCFLVEQKSSVLSILAKQQESSIDVLKNYCKINLVRALSQLKQTENEFADGKFIKIVILYEDYLKAEVLDDIFNLPECNVDNDSYYWLMTICEFEKLMCFYSEDSNGFFDLIREKIQLEENKSNDGRSIEFLLNKRGITENKYLKRKEIAYYQDLVINNLKKHFLTNTLFE